MKKKPYLGRDEPQVASSFTPLGVGQEWKRRGRGGEEISSPHNLPLCTTATESGQTRGSPGRYPPPLLPTSQHPLSAKGSITVGGAQGEFCLLPTPDHQKSPLCEGATLGECLSGGAAEGQKESRVPQAGGATAMCPQNGCQWRIRWVGADLWGGGHKIHIHFAASAKRDAHLAPRVLLTPPLAPPRYATGAQD